MITSLALVLTVIALLAASGCSGRFTLPYPTPTSHPTLRSHSPSLGAPRTTEPPTAVGSAARRVVPGRFVTTPVAVAGRIVVMAVVDGRLELRGYDPATGRMVWHRASTASFVTQGVAITTTHDDRYVYHLSPLVSGQSGPVKNVAYGPGDDAPYARVEKVDARTGAVVWRTDQGKDFVDWPSFCPRADGGEDRAYLCLSEAGRGSTDQVAVADGTLTPTGGPSGRSIGAGLRQLSDRRIARVAGGRTLWAKTQAELFDGLDVDLDSGWMWFVRSNVLLGTIGARDTWPKPDGTYPWWQRHIAGVDLRTGRTLWVQAGDPFCGRLTTPAVINGDHDEPVVRCQFQGTYTVHDKTISSYHVTRATLSGVDLHTGAPTWTVRLAGASAIQDTKLPLVWTSSTTFAIRLDDGRDVVVDVVRGSQRPAPPSVAGWCTTDNEYVYADHYLESSDKRRGETFDHPCRLDGTALRRPAAGNLADAFGATVARRFAWIDKEGLVIVPVGG